MSEFAERLKDLLNEKGLTYQEFSKKSNVSRTTLRFWLKYGVLPKPASIIVIAKYFNCPVDYFIGRTDETKIKFSDNPVKFSDRLKFLIAERKIKQYGVCKDLHIETAMMSDWVNKGIIPNYENFLMLIDYFDCSADYLLGLSEKK